MVPDPNIYGLNSKKPINLGMHSQSIRTSLRAKLQPNITHKTLLPQAHRWTARKVLADKIVDAIAPTDQTHDKALELARKRVPKAKTRAYCDLGNKLYGGATRALAWISYVPLCKDE